MIHYEQAVSYALIVISTPIVMHLLAHLNKLLIKKVNNYAGQIATVLTSFACLMLLDKYVGVNALMVSCLTIVFVSSLDLYYMNKRHNKIESEIEFRKAELEFLYRWGNEKKGFLNKTEYDAFKTDLEFLVRKFEIHMKADDKWRTLSRMPKKLRKISEKIWGKYEQR